MSSLQGAAGDAEAYEPYLRAMGAADVSDAVYASICYCPITDLNHAEMEYEWLYGCTDTGVRGLNDAQIAISNELAALCPAYIDSLDLRDEDGHTVTAANYADYLKTFIMASAQKALDEGCEIPDDIGIVRYRKPQPTFAQRLGAGPANGNLSTDLPPLGDMPIRGEQAPRVEYWDSVTDVDLDKYLSYVATQQALKTPPAFDAYGVLSDAATPENKVFADAAGNANNFTDFSLRKRTGRHKCRSFAVARTKSGADESHEFHRNGAAERYGRTLAHTPRREKPRYVVPRADQSRHTTAERRLRCEFRSAVESPPFRRLQSRRPVPLD